MAGVVAEEEEEEEDGGVVEYGRHEGVEGLALGCTAVCVVLCDVREAAKRARLLCCLAAVTVAVEDVANEADDAGAMRLGRRAKVLRVTTLAAERWHCKHIMLRM